MPALLLVASAAAVIAQDTGSSKPYWILSQSNPKTHVVSRAWLVLPPSPADSAHLTLVHGTTLDAWFADSASSCTGHERRSHAVPPSAGQQVVPVCLRPLAAETTRLLAQIETGRPPGPHTSYVAPSDTIASRHRRSLTPTQLALISAVIGLVAGALTQVVQIVLSNRTKSSETREAIHEDLIEHLLPEMRSHLDLLRQHQSGRNLDESLPMEAYQKLEDDAGILGFLDAKERTKYLGALREYYKGAAEYNIALEQEDPARSESVRTMMFGRLSNYIGRGEHDE